MSSTRVRQRVAVYYPFQSKRMMNAAIREAATAVKDAVHRGDLRRMPCVRCGKRKSEAHHDDYAKPLDVTWLCRFHHRQRDAEIREAWRAVVRDAARSGLPVARLKILAAKAKSPTLVTPQIEARNRPHQLLTRPCAIEMVQQATLAVVDAMDAERVHLSKLAKRMGVSRQMVDANFAGGIRTLKTLAAMADALGYDASVVLTKRESASERVA